MADRLPVSAPKAAKSRAADIELLELDARRALTLDRPATDALWTALLKPRDVILRRYRETIRRAASYETDPDTPAVTFDGRLLGDGPAALIAIAETMVARAILGEQDAAAQIMTRIEGTPAKRKGDEEDSEGQVRGELVQGIEEFVRSLYDHRDRGDKAKPITVDVEPETPPKGKPNGAADH